MIDIIQLVQSSLDTELNRIPIRSYWMQRQELDDDQNPDEYIVYTAVEHEPEAGADGKGLIYRSYVTLRYFVRESWIGSGEKYHLIRQHMNAIRTAMIKNDFDCGSWQNVGDVDGISFTTFILSAQYSEVDRGDGEPE